MREMIGRSSRRCTPQRLGQHLEAHQRLVRDAQLRALREIHLPADDDDDEHGQHGRRPRRCPPGDRDGEEDHDGKGRQQESRERPVRPRQVHEVDAGVDRDEHDQRKQARRARWPRSPANRARTPRAATATSSARATGRSASRCRGYGRPRTAPRLGHSRWMQGIRTAAGCARPAARQMATPRRPTLIAPRQARRDHRGRQPVRPAAARGSVSRRSRSRPAHLPRPASGAASCRPGPDSTSSRRPPACRSSAPPPAPARWDCRPRSPPRSPRWSRRTRHGQAHTSRCTSASAAMGDTRYTAQSPRSAPTTAMCKDVPGGYNATASATPSFRYRYPSGTEAAAGKKRSSSPVVMHERALSPIGGLRDVAEHVGGSGHRGGMRPCEAAQRHE